MKPEKYFERQLKELVNDCQFGLIHYRIWKRLNESFGNDSNTFEVASHFFIATSEAHLNSIRLHLYRLIDNAKGSISITKLIKYAGENDQLFKRKNLLTITLGKHNDVMNDLNPLIKNLLQHRNKHFIHKSGEYLSLGYDNLYSLYKATYKDYEKILISISEILNDYLFLFKDNGLVFEAFGEEADFNDLRYYLKKGIEKIEEENRKIEKG